MDNKMVRVRNLVCPIEMEGIHEKDDQVVEVGVSLIDEALVGRFIDTVRWNGLRCDIADDGSLVVSDW